MLYAHTVQAISCPIQEGAIGALPLKACTTRISSGELLLVRFTSSAPRVVCLKMSEKVVAECVRGFQKLHDGFASLAALVTPPEYDDVSYFFLESPEDAGRKVFAAVEPVVGDFLKTEFNELGWFLFQQASGILRWESQRDITLWPDEYSGLGSLDMGRAEMASGLCILANSATLMDGFAELKNEEDLGCDAIQDEYCFFIQDAFRQVAYNMPPPVISIADGDGVPDYSPDIILLSLKQYDEAIGRWERDEA